MRKKGRGPLTRSETMSRIRSRETGPEVALRRELRRLGLRGYRKNWGRPSVDVAWPGRRLAVFVDSCFWHLCPEDGKVPKTRRDWWQAKLERNRERDAEVTERYRRAGWTVLRFWTHVPVTGMAKAVMEAYHA